MGTDSLASIISNLRNVGAYRPVGVYVLYNLKNEFLLTQSAKNPEYWGFPQGGIDESETLKENLERELREELGILPPDLNDIVAGFYFETQDAEQGRMDKRGFSKGKAYIFSQALYVGTRPLSPNPDEIAQAEWCSYENSRARILQGRQQKAELSVRVLDLVKQKIVGGCPGRPPTIF